MTEAEIVELVRRLAEEFSDEPIARVLHRRQLKTSKGLPLNAKRVGGHGRGRETRDPQPFSGL